jgi:hypothetical protein
MHPNNEDLQVWKGVLSPSDLDDVLLIGNVKIDAEVKLDEASLRLDAQLPISHGKLDSIENDIEMTSNLNSAIKVEVEVEVDVKVELELESGIITSIQTFCFSCSYSASVKYSCCYPFRFQALRS